MTFAGIWHEPSLIPSAWRALSMTRSGRWRMPLASSRAGTLSRMQPSRVRSGGLPVLRTPICPLPTRLCRLLTRLRVWGATIPAHAAAARSSRSAAWTEGRSGPPCQACYDMRRVPHKLARLAVLRSALPRNANGASGLSGSSRRCVCDVEPASVWAAVRSGRFCPVTQKRRGGGGPRGRFNRQWAGARAIGPAVRERGERQVVRAGSERVRGRAQPGPALADFGRERPDAAPCAHPRLPVPDCVAGWQAARAPTRRLEGCRADLGRRRERDLRALSAFSKPGRSIYGTLPYPGARRFRDDDPVYRCIRRPPRTDSPAT